MSNLQGDFDILLKYGVQESDVLRKLHLQYPVENLAEALAEGITTGHPSMPEFQLDPGQISDVIAYLKSLERG